MRADLQLDDYWIDELTVKSMSAEAIDADVLPRIDYEVFEAESEEDGEEVLDKHLVRLVVSATPGRAKRGIPCEFRIQLNGAFSSAPGIEEDERLNMLYYNAPAMLYGIARGLIGELSALGPGRTRYILPSVNFVDILRRKIRRQSAQLRKSQLPSAAD